MCSIFGYFRFDPADSSEKLTADPLPLMANTMRHRGPDGEGFSDSDFASIGMTRLAILDLTNGQQPFHSKDQTIAAVCNGEIYNYKEIRSELQGLGYEFHTECDSEIIPHAYAEWGNSMLHKLHGMFALAILDRQSNTLFLARDRCGQKPLYLAQHENRLYFSSEIRALHKVGIPKVLNTKVLPEYLRLRYVPEPHTLFENIQILPAGHQLSLDSKTSQDGITPSRWWKPQPSPEIAQDKQAQLYDIQRASILQALQADVPIALHLSAGIDSSVLLNEIQKINPEVQAITAGFSSYSDEIKEAKELCKRLNVSHHSVQLGPDDIDSLPQVIAQMELPVGDALILAFNKLAEKTNQLGAKVALGGEGIDEIFAGYSFHRVMQYAEDLGPLGRWLITKSLKALPIPFINRFSAFPASLGKSGVKKISNYLEKYSQLSDLDKGTELRSLFSQKECRKLLLQTQNPPKQKLSEGSSLLDKHLWHQFSDWLQDWSIIRQERNSMAHSIEYRMPFLDHKLIEFGFALDESDKLTMTSGKSIWRNMAKRFYPVTTHTRTKQPFYFPLEEPSYFEKIKNLIETHLSDKIVTKRGLFKLQAIQELRSTVLNTREFLPIKQALSLVILELWMQQHNL